MLQVSALCLKGWVPWGQGLGSPCSLPYPHCRHAVAHGWCSINTYWIKKSVDDLQLWSLCCTSVHQIGLPLLDGPSLLPLYSVPNGLHTRVCPLPQRDLPFLIKVTQSENLGASFAGRHNHYRERQPKSLGIRTLVGMGLHWTSAAKT